MLCVTLRPSIPENGTVPGKKLSAKALKSGDIIILRLKEGKNGPL